VADHYSVLGVEREADQDQIKRAYRKLARELHPDVNPDPEVQDRLKEITGAYESRGDHKAETREGRDGSPGLFRLRACTEPTRPSSAPAWEFARWTPKAFAKAATAPPARSRAGRR